MFAYIRWFSIICFMLVVLASVLVGSYFKEIATNDLKAVVENNNTALAQGFKNTTWNRYRSGVQIYHLFRISGIPFEQWNTPPNDKLYQEMLPLLSEFSISVYKHFADTPIAEIRIYTTDGTLLFATNTSGIVAPIVSEKEVDTVGKDGKKMKEYTLNPHPPMLRSEDSFYSAFQIALSGKIASVDSEDDIVLPDGKVKKGRLIKTTFPAMRDYIPVVAGYKQSGKGDISCVDTEKSLDHNCVEGVIEISYDITPQWNKLYLFELISMLGIISIFVVVISALLYTSHKAENIIAKQHETNLELAAQAASAQAENRDKSQFLANVSHELRTPLNAIIGFSEFIKSERSGPIGSSKYAEYIRDIHSSGVHLLSLINDILDYSKAEADKLEVDVTEVDATKTVKNCVRLVSPRAESAQVNLMEEIPRDHFIIKTDAKKLKQVMLNLLSNAVKFTPSSGSVTVTMWENVVSQSLFIEVKDTGIGIAPKDISRAMAPFGQVDNTLSRKYEGTGLGLPLTRKFVEIMGGTFSIQSEEGKGTTVTISLPKEAKVKSGYTAVESKSPQGDDA